MQIADYEALYSLIRNIYGGDGTKTFCLPDLRGRIPLGYSNSYPIGQKGGTESVTLNIDQLPAHSHAPGCSTSATASSPDANGAVWGSINTIGFGFTTPGGNTLSLAAESIGVEGGDEPHENRMPFQATTYIICIAGMHPHRN